MATAAKEQKAEPKEPLLVRLPRELSTRLRVEGALTRQTVSAVTAAALAKYLDERGTPKSR